MATLTTKFITAEEFMNMLDPDDGTQQELVRGVIVAMPLPKGLHGICCARISRIVGNFVDAHNLGLIASNDTGVILERNPDTVRGPDIAFWSRARQSTIPNGYFEVPPDLAIEVLSPSNSRRKIREKIRDYLFNGVKAVWIVDPEDRSVEVYRNPEEGKILIESATLEGEDALPGFRCKVADLFPPAE